MLINGIFEGGGIKGIAYIGAIKYLNSRGIFFFRCGGTSAGAIIAALVAVGYNGQELWDIVNMLDVNNLKTSMSVKEVIKTKGLYTIESLEAMLDELVQKKGKRYFGDLKYGDDYLLKIVVTDFSNKQLVVIPNDLKKYGISPDSFMIAKAMVMSSSIPIFYQPYKIGNYTFYDGGIVSNFPTFLFDDIDENIETIGFRVHDNKNQSVALNVAKKMFFNKKEIHDINISSNTNNISNIIDNTISIDTSFVNTIDFKKGLLYKTHLYNTGYYAARDFFYRRLI